jgi:hypothetical protein
VGLPGDRKIDWFDNDGAGRFSVGKTTTVPATLGELEVVDVNGDTSKTGWVAIIHMGTKYCDLKDNNPTDPTAPLPDLPVSITVGDDVTYEKQTVNLTLKPK